MKAKDIASQLGNLAAATSSFGNYNTDGIDTDIPDELQEPDPIFTVSHDEILDKMKNLAVKSVKNIINSIIPDIYQNNPLIKDKAEQDAEQLGQLYYQQNMNNIMIKVIMDTIARGDTTAKLFDSYTKLISIAKDFNKQINEMQNQFRKYYVDTYLDLQHKEDEDTIIENNSTANKRSINANKKTLAVVYDEVSPENIDRRETSTKDAVLKIQDYKKELYRKQFEEQNKGN